MTTCSTRWIEASLTCYDDEEYATRELPSLGRALLELAEDNELLLRIADEPGARHRQENEPLL